MTADSIKIECDEDGFHLIVEFDEEHPLFQSRKNKGWLRVNVTTCAEELHEQVTRIIGSWLAEGRAAARMPASAIFACAPDDVDESGGYAANDPKSPQFHSVHADLYDARAGK